MDETGDGRWDNHVAPLLDDGPAASRIPRRISTQAVSKDRRRERNHNGALSGISDATVSMRIVRCRTEQAHAPGDVVDQLPPCDLIVSRDALQHLPVPDIKKALENFSRSEAKYLLCSIQLRRFGWRNGREMRVGRCRDRNLLLDPFNLADPIAIYSEQDAAHKLLGLWRIPLTYVDDR